MIIESLRLDNYRNYNDLDIELAPGTNILYGDNAQGKTNILESIYVCATTRSHRGSKDREVISFGREEAHIRLNLKKKDVPYRIDIHLRKNRPKGVAINGIPIKKASELFGVFNVVFFSPEDLSIIKNGPADRRRFIDMELCQLSKLYVHSLVSYNRILAQRNRLLKDMSYSNKGYETLDVLDMQLVQYGREVIGYRETFIRELGDIIKGIHQSLSGDKEDMVLHYDKNIEADKFEEAIRAGRESDVRYKMTHIGPHRDDMGFLINDVDLRKYGSQGQQRTAALSLKLSEIELVKAKVSDTPVLLLDDVLSELDGNRQNQLLKAIEHIQTVITCTGLEDFISSNFHIDKLYKVIDGTVTLGGQI